MKRCFRHLIAAIALMMTPLNALGNDVSWGNASSSGAIEPDGIVPWNADADTETILDEILTWTVTRTDYEAPEIRPQIDFQPESFFIDQVCSSHGVCSAKGVYRDGEGHVVLHEDFRDLKAIGAQAMLVHELVHLLQDRSGQWTGDDCRSRVAREREAYLLQRRYLIARGGFPPFALRLPSISEAACYSPARHSANAY